MERRVAVAHHHERVHGGPFADRTFEQRLETTPRAFGIDPAVAPAVALEDHRHTGPLDVVDHPVAVGVIEAVDGAVRSDGE
jgi:hypothetical protein